MTRRLRPVGLVLLRAESHTVYHLDERQAVLKLEAKLGVGAQESSAVGVFTRLKLREILCNDCLDQFDQMLTCCIVSRVRRHRLPRTALAILD